MATTLTISVTLPTMSGDQLQHAVFDGEQRVAIEKCSLYVTKVLTGMIHGTVAASVGLADTGTITLSGAMSGGDTVTVAGSALTASTTVNTGTNFLVGVSADADVVNLIACINRNCQYGAVAYRASSGVATVSAVEGGSAAPAVSLSKSSSAVTLSGLSSGATGNLSGGSAALDTAWVTR